MDGGENVEDFEAIYIRYFDSVYKYVFSLCKNESLAEEMTQEAFYRAMEHMDSFEGRSTLYVWLCQIAKNTLLTHLKRQRRSLPEGEIELSRQEAPGPEGALLDREAARRLHQLLHDLKEPYKEVFTLRVFGELPFSQIGELFDRSDSWARLIFYRAKRELRREFHEDTL